MSPRPVLSTFATAIQTVPETTAIILIPAGSARSQPVTLAILDWAVWKSGCRYLLADSDAVEPVCDLEYKWLMSDVVVTVEETVAAPHLLHMEQAGPASIGRLLRLIQRGDWKARALAVSALALVARETPFGRILSPVYSVLPNRLRTLARKLPQAGYHRRLSLGPVANRLKDRSWFVRTASALALGSLRERDAGPLLHSALTDPMRPVRIAAAAALSTIGIPITLRAEEILAGAYPAPVRIGSIAPTTDWIEILIRPHLEVLKGWQGIPAASSPSDLASWARFLAGERPQQSDQGVSCEIDRYVHDTESEYIRTKPFNSIDPEHNIRLLERFAALAANLRAPNAGRVIDLGGGSGWVSELLSKLGYHPITVDVAEILLRFGRDRFRRENRQFRCAVADMTRLPFRAQSIDAIVLLDALHHVPDMPAVFREAARVLVPGGQLLAAEPGEGHSETEQSLREIFSHGLYEGEVHIHDVVHSARSAGFDSIRILPHYEPTISLTPEQLDSMMTAPSDRWVVERGGEPVHFDEFLMQSTYNQPIIICAKGRRTIDSRQPGHLSASLNPDVRRNGKTLSGIVRIANRGDTVWLARTARPGCVRLGFQLMTPERHLISRDYWRVDIAEDLRPSGTMEVPVCFELPDARTGYVIKLDLVAELVCWFEERGSAPVYIGV